MICGEMVDWLVYISNLNVVWVWTIVSAWNERSHRREVRNNLIQL